MCGISARVLAMCVYVCVRVCVFTELVSRINCLNFRIVVIELHERERFKSIQPGVEKTRENLQNFYLSTPCFRSAHFSDLFFRHQDKQHGTKILKSTRTQLETCFTGKIIIFESCEAQETRQTRRKWVLPAAQSHCLGLCSPAFNSSFT